METQKEMKTVEIDMNCDKCGGKMRPNGMMNLTYPPQFPHKCQNCDAQCTFGVKYPYIKHVAIEDTDTIVS